MSEQDHAAKSKTCQWDEQATEYGEWTTECGNAELFTIGGVEENHYVYCPYCAGKIVPVLWVDDYEDDEGDV